MESTLRDMVNRISGIHQTMADSIGNPDKVYCKECGREEEIDAATCFRMGWPTCCGYTMTIDSPKED